MSDPDFTSSARVGTLVIHGVGLIGGSLGMAARRRGLAREVVGVGRDQTRLEAAVRLGAIDRYIVADDSPSIADACSGGDLIVLCTPVSHIVADLPAVLGAIGPGAVVTDVGSVKQVIVEAAEGDPRFVGSHPMAGSELAGVYAAKPELFDDAMWALTPTETTSPEALACVRSFAQAVGARTRIVPAAQHDEAVAITSHLPHVIAYALALLAAQRSCDNPSLPFLTAGSYTGATRVAGSLPSLWTDICRANQASVSSALRDYRAALEAAQNAIDEGDWIEVGRLFDLGHEARRNWPGR